MKSVRRAWRAGFLHLMAVAILAVPVPRAICGCPARLIVPAAVERALAKPCCSGGECCQTRRCCATGSSHQSESNPSPCRKILEEQRLLAANGTEEALDSFWGMTLPGQALIQAAPILTAGPAPGEMPRLVPPLHLYLTFCHLVV